MIASLLSDDNAWINAQTIEVGGGYMIRSFNAVSCSLQRVVEQPRCHEVCCVITG